MVAKRQIIYKKKIRNHPTFDRSKLVYLPYVLTTTHFYGDKRDRKTHTRTLSKCASLPLLFPCDEAHHVRAAQSAFLADLDDEAEDESEPTRAGGPLTGIGAAGKTG